MNEFQDFSIAQKPQSKNHTLASALRVDASLPSGDDGEEKAVCYLCLDVGLEPLRRDCARRGTEAGFVHLSCLTNYAATKSERAHILNDNGIGFSNAWVVCGTR